MTFTLRGSSFIKCSPARFPFPAVNYTTEQEFRLGLAKTRTLLPTPPSQVARWSLIKDMTTFASGFATRRAKAIPVCVRFLSALEASDRIRLELRNPSISDDGKRAALKKARKAMEMGRQYAELSDAIQLLEEALQEAPSLAGNMAKYSPSGSLAWSSSMDSFQNAIAKIEKMIRISRLNDLDSLMKVGQTQRISEVGDSISKLDPGGYLIGCGPYTQGIYRLSASETIFGRQATLHEEPVGKVLDFSINDCVTFRPREVSRRHFKITQNRIDSQAVYFITDLGARAGRT